MSNYRRIKQVVFIYLFRHALFMYVKIVMKGKEGMNFRGSWSHRGGRREKKHWNDINRVTINKFKNNITNAFTSEKEDKKYIKF